MRLTIHPPIFPQGVPIRISHDKYTNMCTVTSTTFARRESAFRFMPLRFQQYFPSSSPPSWSMEVHPRWQIRLTFVYSSKITIMLAKVLREWTIIHVNHKARYSLYPSQRRVMMITWQMYRMLFLLLELLPLAVGIVEKQTDPRGHTRRSSLISACLLLLIWAATL